MTNWAYDEPEDELATMNRHVVYTEEQILEEYGPHWRARYYAVFNKTPREKTWKKDCIEDWIVVNWAYRTDEEPGVTITPIE